MIDRKKALIVIIAQRSLAFRIEQRLSDPDANILLKMIASYPNAI